MRRLWTAVVLKSILVALVLIALWALKNKDAYVVYMQF
jgi:hypothetical protein